MKRLIALLTVSVAVMTSTAYAKPKNIILLIGDGMGESEIALTRDYRLLPTQSEHLENSFKHRGFRKV